MRGKNPNDRAYRTTRLSHRMEQNPIKQRSLHLIIISVYKLESITAQKHKKVKIKLIYDNQTS